MQCSNPVRNVCDFTVYIVVGKYKTFLLSCKTRRFVGGRLCPVFITITIRLFSVSKQRKRQNVITNNSAYLRN